MSVKKLMFIKNKIAIIIPRLDNSGPVRGALAAATGLSKYYFVTLIVLKDIDSGRHPNQVFETRFLGSLSVIKKIQFLRSLRSNSFHFISYCFSADLISVVSGISRDSIINIRGNLFQNYYYDYNIMGILLAFLHYSLCIFFKSIFVLNSSAQRQLWFVSRRVVMIPNFIDEGQASELMSSRRPSLTPEAVQLVFVGSLSKRKNLTELIEVLAHGSFHRSRLTIIGDGPQKDYLKQLVNYLDIEDRVVFVGHVQEPIKLLQDFDVFVLPSLSEGTSRAALEALYSGLKCVLRDVDSNGDLIQSAEQGYLFTTRADLRSVLNQIDVSRPSRVDHSLLPDTYRFEACINKYKKCIDNLFH